MARRIWGVTGGDFAQAREAGSDGKTRMQATRHAGAKMFTMLLPLQPQSAPCFSRFSFTESASANYTETNKMECKPNPLIKLRILCYAHRVAKVAPLAALGAKFDANSNAASGAVLDATLLPSLVTRHPLPMPPTDSRRSSAQMSAAMPVSILAISCDVPPTAATLPA